MQQHEDGKPAIYPTYRPGQQLHFEGHDWTVVRYIGTRIKLERDDGTEHELARAFVGRCLELERGD